MRYSIHKVVSVIVIAFMVGVILLSVFFAVVGFGNFLADPPPFSRAHEFPLGTLDTALRILWGICFAAGPCMFISLSWIAIKGLPVMKNPYTKVNKPPKRLLTFVFTSGGLFLGSVILMFPAGRVMESILRKNVKNFLQEVSSDVHVTVNGQDATDPNRVMADLLELIPYTAHHSHPTKRIPVEITGQGQRLTLILGRDSSENREYWVFCPKYRYTSSNEIGRITTHLFDDY